MSRDDLNAARTTIFTAGLLVLAATDVENLLGHRALDIPPMIPDRESSPSMFAGLSSRWVMPLWCAAAMASAIGDADSQQARERQAAGQLTHRPATVRSQAPS